MKEQRQHYRRFFFFFLFAHAAQAEASAPQEKVTSWRGGGLPGLQTTHRQTRGWLEESRGSRHHDGVEGPRLSSVGVRGRLAHSPTKRPRRDSQNARKKAGRRAKRRRADEASSKQRSPPLSPTDGTWREKKRQKKEGERGQRTFLWWSLPFLSPSAPTLTTPSAAAPAGAHARSRQI